MKLLSILTLLILLGNTYGEGLTNCKKIWDMTNNINDIPMYSMGIYMCVGTPSSSIENSVILPSNLHNHIENQTKHFLKNLTIYDPTNNTNSSDAFLSNSSDTETTTDYDTLPDLSTSNSSTQEPTTQESTTEEPTTLDPTTPSPTTPSPTTPSPTTPEPIPEPTTPEPIPEPTTPGPIIPEPTTPGPIIPEPGPVIPEPPTTTPEPITPTPSNLKLTDSTNNTKTISKNNNVDNDEKDNHLLILTIILGSIVGIILCGGMVKCILYLIKKKKCSDLLKKIGPEKKDPKEMEEHELDEMERARLKSIAQNRSMMPYKGKSVLDKKNRNSWSKDFRKLRNIKKTIAPKVTNKKKTLSPGLTENLVPVNKDVRQTVREDLLRQAKGMPNGKNNPRIKQILQKLDEADANDAKNEAKKETKRPETPPPLSPPRKSPPPLPVPAFTQQSQSKERGPPPPGMTKN